MTDTYRLSVTVLLSLAVLGSGCDRPDADTRTTNTDLGRVTPISAEQPTRSARPFHFTDMTARAGVTLTHVSGTTDQKPFPAANGSGVGVLDFDRDGQPDLCFATGTPIPVRPGPDRPTTRLLWNRIANDPDPDLDSDSTNNSRWQFDDVTSQARLAHDGYSAGVAVGDFNSDGFPDVFFNCFGRNALFENQGDGTFQEIAVAAKTDDSRWGTSACFFDADNDGLVDLYLCHYAHWSLETNAFCGDRERGIRIFCNPKSVQPLDNVLLGNNGDGTFTDITARSGLDRQPGRSQGVVAADINVDGHIDLYVANDLHPNSLFLGDGSGHFRDASETSGASYSELGQSQAGMGVDTADLDGDGRPELFVTNFENEHNALYANLGNSLFQDVALVKGVAEKALPFVGWGTALADFDGDGAADIVVSNGHTDSNITEIRSNSLYLQPAVLWHNQGNGRFQEAATEAGSYFDPDNRHAGRGLVTVDLDNDADHDLVITHIDHTPALLRNDQLRTLNVGRLQLWLIGTVSNRDAVGSRVLVRHSDTHTTAQQVRAGSSYLSAPDPRKLANRRAPNPRAPRLDWNVEVTWPSGRQDRLVLPGPGRYALIEADTPTPETQSRIIPLDGHNRKP